MVMSRGSASIFMAFLGCRSSFLRSVGVRGTGADEFYSKLSAASSSFMCNGHVCAHVSRTTYGARAQVQGDHPLFSDKALRGNMSLSF